MNQRENLPKLRETLRKSKESRRARYLELKALGFNSYDANKYKDISKSKYQELIHKKLISNREISRIVGGKKNVKS